MTQSKLPKALMPELFMLLEKAMGPALIGGIENANAPFVLMADADDSYDFLETPKFYNKIIEGFDLVQGCRLPNGGGEIEKGARSWSSLSHRTQCSLCWYEDGSVHRYTMFIAG